MANFYKIDDLLARLKTLKKEGKVDFVFPTSVKSVSFDDKVGHTYVGVYKVHYNESQRYRLFKVVFNSSYLDEGYEPLQYLRVCAGNYGLD